MFFLLSRLFTLTAHLTAPVLITGVQLLACNLFVQRVPLMVSAETRRALINRETKTPAFWTNWTIPGTALSQDERLLHSINMVTMIVPRSNGRSLTYLHRQWKHPFILLIVDMALHALSIHLRKTIIRRLPQ